MLSPNISFVLFVVSLLIFISTVGGMFPSSILLRTKTMDSLKAKKLNPRGFSFNKIFVVVQFFLSVTLIIASIIVRSQLLFIQEKSLGFDKDQLLELDISNSSQKEASKQRFEAIRNSLAAHSAVNNVSASMNFTELPWTKLKFDQEDGSFIEIFYNLVDRNYLSTMNIELVEGMDFPENINAEETNMIIVNEALVRELSLEDPLNSQIPGKNFDAPHKIIGVVKDFHFSSLHNKVEPLILAVNLKSIGSGITGLSTYVWPPMYNKILVRLNTENLQSGMSLIESEWKKIDNLSPFIIKFVDDEIDNLYANEVKWGKIVNYSSVFAIIISCLGLIGVMRQTVQNRMKEVGVRKIMGATGSQIFFMLTNKTLFFISTAVILSCPVTWLGVERWLDTFAYRIDLSPVYFLLGALITLAIALLSISLEVTRALRLKPADIVKEE